MGFLNHIDQITETCIEQIGKKYERKELITGVPTGYTEFDKITCGLQPSTVSVITSSSLMIGTAFALNMAQHCALVEKKGVLIFSQSMFYQALGVRLLASVCRIPFTQMRTGKLRDDDWPRLNRGSSMLKESQITIDDTDQLSVSCIDERIKSMFENQRVELVIIDSIQLMQDGKGKKVKASSFGRVLNSLKEIA